MTKLATLPDRETIDKYKGLLDYYLWMGIPVVRKWPMHPPRIPYPPEKINQDRLAYVMRLTPTFPANIKQSYADLPTHRYFRWQDWAVRAYIAGLQSSITYWTYWGYPHDGPHFLVTRFHTIQLGPYITIEWDTDIPGYSEVWIAYTPPYFQPTPKYRRGALWYLDYKPRVYSQAHHFDLTAPPTTHHQVTRFQFPPPYSTYLIFTMHWRAPPYYRFSRSTSAIFTVPPSTWEP
ncbi:hypothetical protein ES703_102786 [subsurface metagenome]